MFLVHRQDKHTDSIAINAPKMRNEMFLLCDNLGQQLCLRIDKQKAQRGTQEMGKEKFKCSKRKMKKNSWGFLRTKLTSKPYKLAKNDEL